MIALLKGRNEKETIMVYFKVLSQNSYGEVEENHVKAWPTSQQGTLSK
jgi:hypothetical protein